MCKLQSVIIEIDGLIDRHQRPCISIRDRDHSFTDMQPGPIWQRIATCRYLTDSTCWASREIRNRPFVILIYMIKVADLSVRDILFFILNSSFIKSDRPIDLFQKQAWLDPDLIAIRQQKRLAVSRKILRRSGNYGILNGHQGNSKRRPLALLCRKKVAEPSVPRLLDCYAKQFFHHKWPTCQLDVFAFVIFKEGMV